MSQIKGKNTKPEMAVRRFLFANGLRYRLHDKKLSGKPDLVLPRFGTVIFINGCFWHGHSGCKFFVVPKTRTKFWLSKINGNIQNDIKKRQQLKKQGWKIIDVWECALKPTHREKTLRKILGKLRD
jgi:DNA mismatch endonuclease, patch repair protein